MGGDRDRAGVGAGEALGVGDEQGEVGQTVQAAGEAIGRAMEGGEGLGGEEGDTAPAAASRPRT